MTFCQSSSAASSKNWLDFSKEMDAVFDEVDALVGQGETVIPSWELITEVDFRRKGTTLININCYILYIHL